VKQTIIAGLAIAATLAAVVDIGLDLARPKETVAPVSKLVRKGVLAHFRR
jgi:hypothetical protein